MRKPTATSTYEWIDVPAALETPAAVQAFDAGCCRAGKKSFLRALTNPERQAAPVASSTRKRSAPTKHP